MAVERVGQLRHPRARVVADDLRHAQRGQLALDEHRDGAVGDGLRGVRVPVRASASGSAQNSEPGPLRSER